MNTPKLISIISSSVGHADPARAGRSADPAHGLDFSQLLGERRSQASPTAIGPRPAPDRPADRAASRDSAAGRNADPAAGRATPARAESPRTPQAADDRAAARSSGGAASSPSTASAQQGADGQPHAADGTQNGAPASDDTAGQAGQPVAAAPDANGGAAAEGAADTGTQADAQLAQQAAEAGLALVAVSQAGQAPDPAATLAAQQAAAAVQNAPAPADALPVQTGQHEAAQPGGAQSPLAAPTIAATLAKGAEPALASGAEPEMADTARLAASRQAPATAGQPTAARPATAPADTAASVAAIAPTAFAAPAPAPVATTAPAATALAFNGAPTPAADAADTAAARSLQDFTAMVEAARATSGTVLPSMAPAAQATAFPQPGAPLGGIPGLMPAGLSAGLPPSSPLQAAPAIAAPLASARWPTEFGRQFISLAQGANGLGQVAELRLDPPELGPLRITINLNDNIAHAVISSPHAAVRQTVENALPQLQQMLEQAGISLGQANVNDQHQPGGNASQGESRDGTRLAGGTGTGAAASDGGSAARENRPADPNALVDTFA